MQTTRQTVSKSSRISLTRNGRSINLLIEGRTALLVFGAIALTYIVYLLQQG